MRRAGFGHGTEGGWACLHLQLALVFVLAATLSSLVGSPARAQSCAPSLVRTPFAGHALPLDASPDPQSMVLVNAYPNLFFGKAVFATAPPDGSDRVVVVEQRGRVRIFEDRPDIVENEVVDMLDLQSIVDDAGNEQGMLGFAFDPDFVSNGYLYVQYTASSACSGPTPAGTCSRIERYTLSASDPNLADPESARLILEVPQNGPDHNGGMLAFGPDGYLYVALGDGGGDASAARDLSSPLGSILRLDVADDAPSLVPGSNPFVDTPGAAAEIFHYGLRNPWRFSFDRATGDLWIGDVGDGDWEEIDHLPAGTPGGVDFGWNECEGDGHDARNGGDCSSIAATHTPPVHEYAHEGGAYAAVTGGYVYRGDDFPELHGAYLFSDVGNQRIWALTPGSTEPPVQIASGFDGVVSFGEDRRGEILVVEQAYVYRLERAGGGGGGTGFPATLSATGLFADVATLTPEPGLIEYDVESPLWSDGTRKRRWMALPGLSRIAFHATGSWDFPIGTAFVKHFEIERQDGSVHRIETRVLLRQEARWIGVTYRWNAAQTDAQLLTDGSVELLDLGGGQTQSYRIPSLGECLNCHNADAGRVLGARTRQLGGPLDEAMPTQSQIEDWSCLGLFDVALRRPEDLERFAAIDDPSRPLQERVRSHLEVNCAVCHRPGGLAPTSIDLRWETPLASMNTIGVGASEGDLGVPGADRIRVGAKEESVLWLRLASLDEGQRMAPGTRVPDAAAVSAVGAWIDGSLGVLDSDGDGVEDEVDACPTIADPGQADRDQDGVGDACDPDDLPDLVMNAIFAPIFLDPEARFSIVGTIRNDGGATTGELPVTYYVSTDEHLDPTEDISLGTCWVDAVAPSQIAGCWLSNVELPDSLLEGATLPLELRWIACADRFGLTPDPVDANDCLVASQPIFVPEPDAALQTVLLASGAIALAALHRRSTRRRRHAAPGRPFSPGSPHDPGPEGLALL